MFKITVRALSVASGAAPGPEIITMRCFMNMTVKLPLPSLNPQPEPPGIALNPQPEPPGLLFLLLPILR